MNERPGFFDGVYDFTVSNLRNLRAKWRDIAGPRGVAITGRTTDLTADDLATLREQMRDCLDGRGGEVSARVRAAALGRTYLSLNAAGRERFLLLLTNEFDIDRTAVDSACTRLLQAKDPVERHKIERALRQALVPPRVKLMTQFNALPEGVKFLVDMRAEQMALARHDPTLAPLDLDLKGLLASWFDIGFLEVKRITWDSPAALLEKLMGYEAVHAIRSWSDLKNRLEADRRCFAYFHPRMPDEPLIFVEVALTRGISNNIQSLLDETAPVGDPMTADTAIFYSISNCQRGLSGISFGDFLIKRVVDHLAAELPHLTTYATLSPIPGFRAWLDERLADEGDDILTPAEQHQLAGLPGIEGGLAGLLARPDWYADAETARVLKAPLQRLAIRYLVNEKAPSGRALDPVAHFHLSNGARLEQLDWLADLSPKGIQQSAGMMINYLYRLPDIERNHEAYTGEGQVNAAPVLLRPLRAAG